MYLNGQIAISHSERFGNIPSGYGINSVDQVGRYLRELQTLTQCRLVEDVKGFGVKPVEVRVEKSIRLHACRWLAGLSGGIEGRFGSGVITRLF